MFLCHRVTNLPLPLNSLMESMRFSRTVTHRGGGLSKGVTMKISENRISVFWSRVNKNGPVPKHVPHLGPCWNWTGCIKWSKPNLRYGCFYIKGKRYISSRVSYVIKHGEIPFRLLVLHRCDNAKCVNPSHLELGDYKKNNQDCAARGRNRAPKGDACSWRKLSSKDVLYIRKMRLLGVSCQKLADQFGVNNTNISSISRRRTWKHL